MSKYGPSVTKLILKLSVFEAIPPGGGFADGVKFFTDSDHRKQVMERSEAKALKAIDLIKSAPDNPHGDDDEAIAEMILVDVEKRLALTKGALP